MNATESLLLVLDHHQPLYNVCMYYAAKGSDRYAVADEIKDHLENVLDDIQLTREPGNVADIEGKELLVVQFVSHMLDNVDWHEVADHYLGKVAEEAKGGVER